MIFHSPFVVELLSKKQPLKTSEVYSDDEEEEDDDKSSVKSDRSSRTSSSDEEEEYVTMETCTQILLVTDKRVKPGKYRSAKVSLPPSSVSR